MPSTSFIPWPPKKNQAPTPRSAPKKGAAETARTRLNIKDPATGAPLGKQMAGLLQLQDEMAKRQAATLMGVKRESLALDDYYTNKAVDRMYGETAKDRAVQLAGITASQQALIDDRAMKSNQFAEQLRDQRNNDAFRQKMMEQSMEAQRLAETNAFWERAGIRARESLAEQNRMHFQKNEANKDRQLEQSRMQIQDGQNMRQLAIQSEANQRAAQEAAEQRLSNERLAMNASALQQLQWDRDSASSRRNNLLNFAMSGLRYS